MSPAFTSQTRAKEFEAEEEKKLENMLESAKAKAEYDEVATKEKKGKNFVHFFEE